MSVQLWKGHYFTWEREERFISTTARPVDGWAAWLLTNLMRMTVRVGIACLMGVGVLLLLSSFHWMEAQVYWILEHKDLIPPLVILSSLILWIKYLRWHPFESSRDAKLDRILWPLVSWWLDDPATSKEQNTTVTSRRWLKVPVDIALQEGGTEAKLTWSVRYVDAEPLTTPPEHLAAHSQGVHGEPPRLPNGSVTLKERNFALDLFRVPWADPVLALQVRSTQRQKSFAFAVEPGVIKAPDLEIQRLPILARARIVLPPGEGLRLAEVLRDQAAARGAQYPRYLDPKPKLRMR